MNSGINGIFSGFKESNSSDTNLNSNSDPNDSNLDSNNSNSNSNPNDTPSVSAISSIVEYGSSPTVALRSSSPRRHGPLDHSFFVLQAKILLLKIPEIL